MAPPLANPKAPPPRGILGTAVTGDEGAPVDSQRSRIRNTTLGGVIAVVLVVVAATLVIGRGRGGGTVAKLFPPFFDHIDNPVPVDFPPGQAVDITPPPPRLGAFGRAVLDLCGALGDPVAPGDFASLLGRPEFRPIGRRAADALSIKLATCGGLRCARQVDAVARAARLDTLVGCVNEPALLIAAGLSFALSSPSVRYGDLDGHFDLVGDPTVPGFVVKDGWLIATEVPGLGCTVEL